MPIDEKECNYNCTRGAACMCDTLGSRGAPQCGCQLYGNYITVLSGKEGCASKLVPRLKLT